MVNRTGQSAIFALASAGRRRTAPRILTGKKWHPGWGVMIGEDLAFGTSLASTSTKVAELVAVPNARHVMLNLYWGALEQTFGVYTTQIISDFLEICEKNDKLGWINFYERAYTGSSAATQVTAGRIPGYINTAEYGLDAGGEGTGLWHSTAFARNDVKIWLEKPMDRWIALSARLAEEFDSHPRLEGVNWLGETGSSTDSPDFDADAHLTQCMRLVTATSGHWSRTNVAFGANSGFTTVANRVIFMDHLVAHPVMMSGPDIRTDDFWPYDYNALDPAHSGVGGTQFQRLLRGIEVGGGASRIGLIANGPQIQSPNIGGDHTPLASSQDPTTTLAFLRDVALNKIGCTHVFILRKATGNAKGGADNDQFWNSAASGYVLYHPTIKEFLQQAAATIALNTAAPANYASVGVDTT